MGGATGFSIGGGKGVPDETGVAVAGGGTDGGVGSGKVLAINGLSLSILEK